MKWIQLSFSICCIFHQSLRLWAVHTNNEYECDICSEVYACFSYLQQITRVHISLTCSILFAANYASTNFSSYLRFFFVRGKMLKIAIISIVLIFFTSIGESKSTEVICEHYETELKDVRSKFTILQNAIVKLTKNQLNHEETHRGKN